MKSIAILLIAVAITPPAIAAEDHRTHPSSTHTQLSLNHGSKWATDEPLRTGMTNIRTSLTGQLQQIHNGEMSADDYSTLGTAVHTEITIIIAQCKLEPQADAMLHIILSGLLAGADAMQGKGEITPASGAHKIIESLNAYGEYFNHPGWTRLP